MDRVESTRRLLDSLEADWNLDLKERLLAMLWALHENLVKLEFFDLANRLHGMVLDKGTLNIATGERLRFHFFPEIRYRLQESEGHKAKQLALDHLHPKIKAVSIDRFKAGHFADAVEAAFKEVNAVVKHIVLGRLGQELDGATLMERAFSVRNPVIELADLSTESGQSVQVGYLKIFSGAMTGIRNPKAHANLHIEPEEAVHLLSLASLLMIKVDSCIEPKSSQPQNPAAPADQKAPLPGR